MMVAQYKNGRKPFAAICADTAITNSAAKIPVPVRYPSPMDMETASPAVSPSVVAAILTIQKSSVTSGTLLKVASTASLSLTIEARSPVHPAQADPPHPTATKS